jgi:CubicO group peptidase (beta-lactamase class C family)
MDSLHVPGAVFVYVADGRVVFKKGYGYADVVKRTPVDPDTTLFQIASVSKLFTATALMQLYEQGKVKLDEDVNTYLTTFKVPSTYPAPVTVRSLLTHTSGFDERGIGSAGRTAAEWQPLGDYLKARLPPRVRPVGDASAYSNHGVALEGYIVEQVSGMPFNDYVAQKIYRPLGMSHSTFAVIDPLPPTLAQGYEFDGLRYTPQAHLYNNLIPAGGLMTSGDDIAKFMIAHLDNGRYGDARILGDAAIEEMHKRQFTHDARIEGYAGQFFEDDVNGYPALQHGGDLPGFCSLLYLIPEKNAGFFVSMNADREKLRELLLKTFMNRFYPPAAKPPQMQVAPDFAARAERYVGVYRDDRHEEKTLVKLTTLLTDVRITTGGKDGELILQANEPQRLVEVDGDLFHAADSLHGVVFKPAAANERDRLLTEHASFRKLARWEEPRTQWLFLAVVVLLFASQIAVSIDRAFVHRVMRKPNDADRATRIARALALVTAIVDLVLLIGLGWGLVGTDQNEFAFGMPLRFKALLCLPPVSTALAAAMLVAFVVLLLRAGVGTRAKLHYFLVTAAAVSLAPFFWYWNLYGFRW